MIFSDRANADNTNVLTAGSQAAVTTSAGDNNGFQTTPTNTTASDNAYAVDTNSGTGNATDGCGTFPQSEDDQHDFFTFGISIPAGSTIDGIIVTEEGHVDSATGPNIFCTALSWNGGSSWTSAKSSSNLTTGDTTSTMGSASDTWGRTWTPSELNDSNFRLRIMMDSAAANTRDYSLDYLTVQIYYTPNTTVSGTIYSDEGTTVYTTSGKTLKMAIGTSSPGIFSTTTCSGCGGQYRFDTKAASLSAGVPLLVWTDADVNLRSVVFTKASTTNNITGLDLYQNRIVLRMESASGTSTSISDLAFYDSDNDGDIQFTANNGILTVKAGQMLYLWPGSEFNPGGNVSVLGGLSVDTDGSIKLPSGTSPRGDATSTILSMNTGTLSLAGSFLASSSPATNAQPIFNTLGTTTLTATTTGKRSQIIATSTPFYKLEIASGINATTTFAASTTVTNLFAATTSNVRIEFASSATSTFQNAEVKGAANNLNYFHSLTPGSSWNINIPGTNIVSYANIKDSNACATSLSSIDVSDGTSVDGGNNQCWNFPSATYTQRNYGWAINDGNLGTGGLAAAVNSPITGVLSGRVVRLRVGVGVSGGSLSSSAQTFSLQYAPLVTTCSAGSYSAVGSAASASIWRGYDNVSVPDQNTLTNVLIDSNNTKESYEENGGPSIANPNAISSGGTGEWDWVLQDNGAAVNTTYCFRMVKGASTAFSTYSNYAMLTTSNSTAVFNGSGTGGQGESGGSQGETKQESGATNEGGGQGSEGGGGGSSGGGSSGGGTGQGGGGGGGDSFIHGLRLFAGIWDHFKLIFGALALR